ncbi:MAG: site-specific integrase [Candidatus Heimdallarchaeaceae archaeon]
MNSEKFASFKIRPIADEIDLFLSTRHNIKERTRRHYYDLLNKMYQFTQISIPDEHKLGLFLKQIRETRSETTYNQYLSIIKMYYNFLARRKLVKNIDFLKDYRLIAHAKINRNKKAYTEEEIQEFLKEVRPRWKHYFLFLAFYFAFRPIEISRLRLENVNIDKQYFVLNEDIQKVRKISYIAIPDRLVNKIHELLSWRSLQRSDNDYLLVNTRGNRLNKSNIDHQLVVSCRKIDPDFILYNCRYTAAWRAYEKTRNIYAAQQLLRHESPKQTMIYLNIQHEKILEAQRKDMVKIYEDVYF